MALLWLKMILTSKLNSFNLFLSTPVEASFAPNMERLTMAKRPLSRSLLGAALLCGSAAAAAAEDLNALIWCDHSDPALLEPFEAAHGVKVNVKEYEGTAAGLAILAQSQPGDWDVMVIDAVDVGRAVDLDLLAPLPADKLANADFFPEMVMADHNSRDGVTYAVTEKFGYNTIAYDKTKVDPADMADLSSLTSGKYDGRIAIYDYYLPVIGLVGLAKGIATADLNAENVEGLRDTLYALKAASKQVGDVVSSQTALATGEVDILIGGGEWLTAVLQAENPNLDWTIAKQGALRWAQSIAVLKGSTKPDLALEFVNYITSPEGQARLATASCYWGMPANAKAGEHLTPEQKTVLRWDQQAEYLARSQLYPVPDAELDTKMQDLWTDMLQH
jgi:spermidine/putrescine transport system substrate-binding protein